MLEQLESDLSRDPPQFGYEQPRWSGMLLARHLRRYGVDLGARRCRQLLRKYGVPAPTPIKAKKSAPGLRQRDPWALAPLADWERKRRALARMRRLAVAGLPLEPFVMTLFDLINDGVSNAATKVLLADSDRPEAFFSNSAEAAERVSSYERYFVRGSAAESGMRLTLDSRTCRTLASSKTAWRLEELLLPNFYRSAGFNEVLRPLGFHHNVLLTWGGDGEAVGIYPVWRGADQKPFSQSDMSFLEACAPHIAHGLRIAELIDARSLGDGSEFVARPGWEIGAVLMDTRGRVTGLDDSARAIFSQLTLLEATRKDPMLPASARDILDYVASIVNSIGEHCTDGGPPAARAYCHRSGVMVKMRAVAIDSGESHRQFVVLVERGESARQRLDRFRHRYGLRPRELEILRLLASPATPRAISAALGVNPGTLKSDLRRLSDKLGQPDRVALRRFAGEHERVLSTAAQQLF